MMKTTQGKRASAALSIANVYGGVEGETHKQWVIDQMVRALLGFDEDPTDYERWINDYGFGPNAEICWEWDFGTAP